jgi:Mg/Co/Ni transporter MgtE
MIGDSPAYQKTDFATNSFVSIVFIMSATDVIRELKELPSREREKVLRWLQQQGLKDLWARADALMKDAPRVSEDEILRLPRVRPSGF